MNRLTLAHYIAYGLFMAIGLFCSGVVVFQNLFTLDVGAAMGLGLALGLLMQGAALGVLVLSIVL